VKALIFGIDFQTFLGTAYFLSEGLQNFPRPQYLSF
jgi:hypothetical protein